MSVSDELLKDLELKAEAWADVVAPIFGDSNKRFVAAEGFGTGFLTLVENRIYFVTADHVVAEFGNYGACVANISGKSFDIGLLSFCRDGHRDFSSAKVPDEELAKLDLNTIKYCDLDRDWSGWRQTGVYVVMGYPASKNELKPKFGRADRNGLNIFCVASSATPRTMLPDYLALAYDPKRLRTSQGDTFNSPKLNGISGGPCFEIMSSQSELEVIYSFKMVGLVSEFHPGETAILVVPVTARNFGC